MNYSLLIIGDSKVDRDGGEVDGDGRDVDGDRWRWLCGHFPVLAGCQNRDLAVPPMCEGGLWPPSGSLSVFGKLPGKIRLLALVSSNSENISYVSLLKHKNSKKQGTDTVATC
jgi:hypothetical protein